MTRNLVPGALVVGLLWLAGAASARADVVDEHHSRAVERAKAGQWEESAREIEQALDLLPGRSALLSYNLGTAYANLGQNGRATFHLRRALQPQALPSTEIAEAARRNLGIVRSRVETAAAVSGAQIDPPETWWDLVLTAVRAPAVGILALACGWLGFFLWGYRRVRRARAAAPSSLASVAGSMVAVLLAIFVVAGALHGLALQADETTPVAIVLTPTLEVREAPGAHRKQVFAIQGGSQVRITERAHGWCQIRLNGGLGGWVPETTLGELYGQRRRQRARASALPAGDSEPKA